MPSLTVRNGNDESSGKTEYGDPSRQRLQSLVMLILFLSTILFFWAGELAEGQNPVNVEAKAVKNASATYNLDEITDTVNHTGGSIEKEPCLFDSDEMADSKKGKEESIVNKVQDGIVAEEKKEVPAEEIVEEKKEDAIQKEFNSNTADNGGVCSDVCFDRRKKRTEQFGGDLLDRKDIIQLVTAEKEKMIKKLHHDYGKDNFEKMFVDNGENPNESGFRGIKPFTAGGESMKRLKRKIQIKVLSMQVLLKNSESNINGCDCTNGDKSLGKSVERTEAATAGIDTKYSKYVWATGGHSAAAGHGNMYNESYTAYMERDVKGIFESIGIEFEARNYAMGGSRSGLEIAMCSEQIYGSDVDFISWDFGMTDGKEYFKLLMYAYRAVLAPGHPAFLFFNGGSKYGDRTNILMDLETRMGMSVFDSPQDSLQPITGAIPNMFGKNDDEIAKMPEYVRYLKCQDAVEKGDPFCSAMKYSNYTCSPRKKQTGWHPGYKAQAISGHVLSFFLVHALLSSLDDLAENSNQDPEKLLAELQNEEYHQNQDFLHAELPEYIYRQYPGYVAKGKGVPEAYYLEPKPEVPIEIMNLTFQGPSLCHTARLPSRTRYLGYLFNNGKVGDVAPYGNETYETGIFKDEADKTEAYGEMRLAYTIYKERQAGCNSVLAPDYGDYFYAHQKDDWAKLAFPNDAEKAAYRYHQSNYRGLLAVSFKGCAWGKCPDGQIQQGGFDEGQFEMKVNGKKVVKIFKFSGDVSFLLHKDGLYFTPSSNDDYEISIRVKKPGGYLKISSFILY